MSSNTLALMGAWAAGVGVACSPAPSPAPAPAPSTISPLALDPEKDDVRPTLTLMLALAREAADPRLESACVCTSGDVLIGLGPSECEYELGVVVVVVYAPVSDADADADADGGA